VLRTYYDEHRRPATLLRCDTDAGTLTTDVTVRRYFDRSRRSQDRDIPAVPVGVASSETESALPCGTGFRIPGGGGRFVE
jgi:hypothetical protein